MHQIRNTASSGIVPVLVENTSGETIPPYSVVAIGQASDRAPGAMTRDGEGVGTGRFKVKVRKPDAAAVDDGSVSLFLITLDLPIRPGGNGYATASLPTWAQLEGSGYQRGEAFAPQAGSWKLHPGEGFYRIREIKTFDAISCGLVDFAGGGGGGGADAYTFTLLEDHNGYIPGNEPLADIYDPITHSILQESSARMYDPLSMFLGIKAGTTGICLKQAGGYLILQAQCAPEELVEEE
jgi:hypothetical protein